MVGSTELYTNLTNVGLYHYPREFSTNVKNDNKEMTTDGIEYINITITGIPDGVPVLANEALVDTNSVRRLYIFSDTQLSDQYLTTVDEFYGKTPYPIVVCSMPNVTLESVPKNNFYLTDGPPSSISEFVEYRYLNQRHLLTNIAFDATTNSIYKLILPKNPLIVIIMPNNFIRTALKTGYFKFDNNLIIRIYSQYMLSSTFSDEDEHNITLFDVNNIKLKSAIEKIFAKFGMHKIVSNRDNQIYGYDKFMTMVVGRTSNIILP